MRSIPVKGDDAVLQRYYRTFVHDTFGQVIRIADLKMANELGLEHFIYAGGLIETSRHFCVKKNDKVFHKSEANKWKNDPDLPGKESNQSYNPLIDLGRWNCRHHLIWVSKEYYDKNK